MMLKKIFQCRSFMMMMMMMVSKLRIILPMIIVTISRCTLQLGTETFKPHTTPIGLYKRKKVTRAITPRAEVDVYCEETQRKAENSLDNSNENAVEATKHRDVLILFRFDDRDLPFKLKQIITPDLRFLRLLEAGLPSWALFL